MLLHSCLGSFYQRLSFISMFGQSWYTINRNSCDCNEAGWWNLTWFKWASPEYLCYRCELIITIYLGMFFSYLVNNKQALNHAQLKTYNLLKTIDNTYNMFGQSSEKPHFIALMMNWGTWIYSLYYFKSCISIV